MDLILLTSAFHPVPAPRAGRHPMVPSPGPAALAAAAAAAVVSLLLGVCGGRGALAAPDRAGEAPGASDPDWPKVGRYRLNRVDSHVESAWFKRLKLRYDKLLSSFAFNFNLRRYTKVPGRASHPPLHPPSTPPPPPLHPPIHGVFVSCFSCLNTDQGEGMSAKELIGALSRSRGMPCDVSFTGACTVMLIRRHISHCLSLNTTKL